MRIPFEVQNVADIQQRLFVLRMKYDAGFVAYLNGTEIARRNASDPLTYDSAATAERATAHRTQCTRPRQCRSFYESNERREFCSAGWNAR